MRKHVLLASGLALILAMLPFSAAADRGHRDRGWDNRWDNRSHWDRWERRQHRIQRRQFRRYNNRVWRHNRAWRNRWFYGPRFRYDYYPHGHIGWRSGFATGALLGSSVNVTQFHNDGDHRYCDHEPADRNRGSGQISGCYRIERLPDGSERRIELPLSDCYD